MVPSLPLLIPARVRSGYSLVFDLPYQQLGDEADQVIELLRAGGHAVRRLPPRFLSRWALISRTCSAVPGGYSRTPLLAVR